MKVLPFLLRCGWWVFRCIAAGADWVCEAIDAWRGELDGSLDRELAALLELNAALDAEERVTCPVCNGSVLEDEFIPADDGSTGLCLNCLNREDGW